MAILDLPTIRPHKLSMATMMNQTMVITRITSEDGISGWGESTTIGGMTYGPESPEGMKLTIDQYIAPLLIGQDATNINLLMHKIEKNVKGNTFAKSRNRNRTSRCTGKTSWSFSFTAFGRIHQRKTSRFMDFSEW